MKNINVKKALFVAMIGLSINASAQVKLGVQAGVNVSSPEVEGLRDKKNISSPTFGVVAQFDIMPLFAFRPSINYLQNAYKSLTTFPANPLIPGSLPYDQEIKNQVTNIEIPLDLIVPLKLKNGDKFLISAAPVVTVGLKATNTVTNTNSAGTTSNKVDIKFGDQSAEIKKVDWGTRFGIGYEFKKGIQINAAYKFGLSDQSNTDNSIKNHNITLSLAWFIIKGTK